MKKTAILTLAIAMILMLTFTMYITSGCSGLLHAADEDNGADEQESEPHDEAFTGSSYLLHMEDLKAINIAANFLKEKGEDVTFIETYIEYHEPEEVPAHLSLINGETLDYPGEYLEVRLYKEIDEDNENCGSCIIIYIDKSGKVLGHNKIDG